MVARDAFCAVQYREASLKERRIDDAKYWNPLFESHEPDVVVVVVGVVVVVIGIAWPEENCQLQTNTSCRDLLHGASGSKQNRNRAAHFPQNLACAC